jgi:hypothetical protein
VVSGLAASRSVSILWPCKGLLSFTQGGATRKDPAMATKCLHDDITALEIFDLASEHEDMAGLIQEWLDAEDLKEKAAIFLEIMELAEQLIVEVDVDFFI